VTNTDPVQLNRPAYAEVERTALAEFNKVGWQWGGEDCKKVLRDWFPRLRERARKTQDPNEDLLEYQSEIFAVVEILDGLRWAFSRNTDRTLYDAVQDRIWAWPGETKLLSPPPKEWRHNSSPADIKQLANKLADYLERPWLQHNIIDGAAINAFLSSAASEYNDLYLTGEAFGEINWTYLFNKHDPVLVLGCAAIDLIPGGVPFQAFLRHSSTGGLSPFWSAIVSVLLRWIAFPFLKWVLLPGIAAILWTLGYELSSEIVLSVWGLYLLYRLVTLPAKLARRKATKRKKENASQTVMAMITAWQYSRGSVINPSRLKELVLDAEQKDAAYLPILHTLMDRAIQRDPTALHTGAA
jgi:hypothetical protein